MMNRNSGTKAQAPIVSVFTVMGLDSDAAFTSLGHALTRAAALFLDDSKCRRIADTTLAHSLHFTAALVSHKPEVAHVTLPILLPYLFNTGHDNADGVPATYRVPIPLQAIQPCLVDTTLASTHAVKVHGFDRLVDRAIFGRFR